MVLLLLPCSSAVSCLCLSGVCRVGTLQSSGGRSVGRAVELQGQLRLGVGQVAVGPARPGSRRLEGRAGALPWRRSHRPGPPPTTTSSAKPSRPAGRTCIQTGLAGCRADSAGRDAAARRTAAASAAGRRRTADGAAATVLRPPRQSHAAAGSGSSLKSKALLARADLQRDRHDEALVAVGLNRDLGGERLARLVRHGRRRTRGRATVRPLALPRPTSSHG